MEGATGLESLEAPEYGFIVVILGETGRAASRPNIAYRFI